MDATHDAVLRATVVCHERLTLAGLRIVLPQEEIAFLGVASVEVLAFIRAVFLHEKEKGRLAAVTYIGRELILARRGHPKVGDRASRGHTEPLAIFKEALLARREWLRFGPRRTAALGRCLESHDKQLDSVETLSQKAQRVCVI